jgi:2-polyprenyl-3-methyl-5-hydroxy-6-metoxy-1,4-benzoquinol methylase
VSTAGLMSVAGARTSVADSFSCAASASYWERRARRFAGEGEGLAAVCSYGMPDFYNRAIQYTQRRALAPWLRVAAGSRVLDVGCGVGRWSRLLAARGALVHGVDLSPTMIAIARARAAAAGVAHRCRFTVQDLCELDVAGKFDLVLGVTVLQHILEPRRLQRAVERMASQLRPTGRMVLLEAAPAHPRRRCDSAVFVARTRADYLRLYAACGLRVAALGGVDPAPFRWWLLPRLARLSRPLRVAAAAAASLLSLPLDALCARRAIERSWHAVFVLERNDRAEYAADPVIHVA